MKYKLDPLAPNGVSTAIEAPVIITGTSSSSGGSGVSIGDAVGSADVSRLLYTDTSGNLSDDGLEYVEFLAGGIAPVATLQPNEWGATDPVIGFADLTGFGSNKQILMSTQGGTGSFVMSNGSSNIASFSASAIEMNLAVDMNSHKITELTSGTVSTDAINLGQLDTEVTALEAYADAKVSDTAYGSGWNGVTGIAPSKNAVYDKIESLAGTPPGGNDTEIQFNDGGSFAGDEDFWWVKTADEKRLIIRRDSSSQTIPMFQIIKDTNNQTLLKFSTPNAASTSELAWNGPGNSTYGMAFRATSGQTSSWNFEGGNSGMFLFGTLNSVTALWVQDDAKIGLGAWNFSTLRGWVSLHNGDSSTVSAAVVNAASQSVDSFRVVTNSGTVLTAVDSGGHIKEAAGSSTAFAKVGGVLDTNTTAVGNVGTGEDDLMTYSVPAATLATNKDYISFKGLISVANNVNAKRVKIKFGSSTILDTGAAGIPVSAAITIVFEGEVVRTGATTQLAWANLSTSNATLASYTGESTPAETLSGAVTLKVTGEAVSNDDIIQKSMIVKWEPAT